MNNVKAAVTRFLRDEEGLTTVEYAIAGGLVGAGVIAAFAALGSQVNRIIDEMQTALQSVKIS